jgi:molybdenum cofactor cytidylyltransferase
MIRGLLLAGGASTRFGAAKLLHPLENGLAMGVVSARHLLEGVGNVLAVVRDGDDELAACLRGAGCAVLVTGRSRNGLGASIAAGVDAARGGDGWVVALADMPCIPARVSHAVAEALEGGALIAAPVLPGGERGHPVGFSARLLEELTALSGDEGARVVVQRHRESVVLVPTEERGILYDVDTPEDAARAPRA